MLSVIRPALLRGAHQNRVPGSSGSLLWLGLIRQASCHLGSHAAASLPGPAHRRELCKQAGAASQDLAVRGREVHSDSSEKKILA